jgi:hypothetical protein
VPLALGATVAPATLYTTADPACSSLYPPLDDIGREYRALTVTALKTKRTITVDTLDNWATREGVTEISFLQLDTQGSELDVLRGATRTLQSVWAVRAEVEFNPIYSQQPLFGDVDRFLRDHGFVLWRLANLCHYQLAGYDGDAFTDKQVFAAGPDDVQTTEFQAFTGRLFSAEAYFVRRELAAGNAPGEPEQAARAACVMATLGFQDLAAVARRVSSPDL